MQQEDLKPFSIEVEPLRDAVRVCPTGELDVATVGELTFVDSTGIHLVLDLAHCSRTDGWRMAVLDGTDPVRRAFDVTGVRAVIPFVERENVQTGRIWR